MQIVNQSQSKLPLDLPRAEALKIYVIRLTIFLIVVLANFILFGLFIFAFYKPITFFIIMSILAFILSLIAYGDPEISSKIRKIWWIPTAATLIFIISLVGTIFIPFVSKSGMKTTILEGSPQALIVGVTQEVEVLRKGSDKIEPAAFGMPIYQGDVVLTYSDSTASLLCENGLLFELPPQNNLAVDCTNSTDTRILTQLNPITTEQLWSAALAQNK